MKDYEKLEKLCKRLENLLENDYVTALDNDFRTWKTEVALFLSRHFGEDSPELKDFLNTSFSLTSEQYEPNNGFRLIDQDEVLYCRYQLEYTKELFATYLEDLKDSISIPELGCSTKHDSVFIVHGHDDALKQSVARLIEKQGIKAVILHEQPNIGATIIEKFEKNSNVGAAICLFTADDTGKAKKEDALKDRARQNVVFEAGFFMGSLGRDRVIILAEQGIELPSDLKGVVYAGTSSWQLDVLRELHAMGFVIDYNKLD